MNSKLGAAIGKRCPYCHRVMERDHPKLQPTRDHVIPQSRNGKETVVCCLQCNGIKGDMMPDQWAAYMAANAGWWLFTRAERRARARADRSDAAANGAAGTPHRRQGSPQAAPVVVPPELVYSAKVGAYERSQSALKAFREARLGQEPQAQPGVEQPGDPASP